MSIRYVLVIWKLIFLLPNILDLKLFVCNFHFRFRFFICDINIFTVQGKNRCGYLALGYWFEVHDATTTPTGRSWALLYCNIGDRICFSLCRPGYCAFRLSSFRSTLKNVTSQILLLVPQLPFLCKGGYIDIVSWIPNPHCIKFYLLPIIIYYSANFCRLQFNILNLTHKWLVIMFAKRYTASRNASLWCLLGKRKKWSFCNQ